MPLSGRTSTPNYVGRLVAEANSKKMYMFLDKETWSLLQERFTCQSQNGEICDVYDGHLYRKHVRFLSNPANVSLMINTDGVAVFKSSSTSLWPIWVVINELPKRKR